MSITDLLGAELQRLAGALAEHEIPVIIGGGYGLLLRQRHVEASGATTLYAIPEARSTEDLDVFLTAELVADAEKMAMLGAVLQDHDYNAIEAAKYYQFARDVPYGGRTRSLKIDLLAPPPRKGTALRSDVNVDARRVRPKKRIPGAPRVHAHTTPEAFTVGEHVLALRLAGAEVDVLVPHPFSFLLLKLFAYRDRQGDAAKDYGRYHAYDLYRIIGMMTESDFRQAEGLRDRYREDDVVVEARGIVAALFSGVDQPGLLALREHAQTVGVDLPAGDLQVFVDTFAELLPLTDASA